MNYTSVNKVTPLSKTLALIMFISLPFIGFYIGYNYKNTLSEIYLQCTKTRESTVLPQNKNITQNSSDTSIEQEFLPLVTFRGVLKVEKIPEELELGDYWLQLNFDEPFLLTQSALGRPSYVSKLEVVGPGDGYYNLADFVNKHVEIYGKFGWGYAESTLIEVVAITVL